MEPEAIYFTQNQDVLTAHPTSADLRVEVVTRDVEFSRATCSLAWENDTPVVFTVHQPHDRTIEQEATDVLAAVYWSRARAEHGPARGSVHILRDGDPLM